MGDSFFGFFKYVDYSYERVQWALSKFVFVVFVVCLVDQINGVSKNVGWILSEKMFRG